MEHEQLVEAGDLVPGKWVRRGVLRAQGGASYSDVEEDYNVLSQIRGEGWHSIHEGAENVRSLK